MSHCETCKFWDYLQFEDFPPTLRDATGGRVYTDDWDDVPAPGRWGWCKRAGEFGPERSDKFYACDGSEYKAALNTRSDFGCVEHEDRMVEAE